MSLLEEIEEDKKRLREMGIDPDTGATIEKEEENGEDDGTSDGSDECEGNEGTEEGELEGGEEGKQEVPKDGTENGDGKAPEGSKASAEEVKEEAPKEASAWAKMRREARALAAEKAELARKLEELQRPKQQEQKEEKKEVTDEPDKSENYGAWLEWKNAKLESQIKAISEDIGKQKAESEQTKTYTSAVDELNGYVDEFAKKQPDVKEAGDHVVKELKKSISLLNPDWNDKQVTAEVGHTILKMASSAAVKGLNPAEELYDIAIERFGYTKKEQQAKQEDTRKSISAIAANKKRSASPLQGGGQSGTVPLTKQSIADMDLSEFSKLTPSQLRALENMDD